MFIINLSKLIMKLARDGKDEKSRRIDLLQSSLKDPMRSFNF